MWFNWEKRSCKLEINVLGILELYWVGGKEMIKHRMHEKRIVEKCDNLKKVWKGKVTFVRMLKGIYEFVILTVIYGLGKFLVNKSEGRRSQVFEVMCKIKHEV